VKKVQTKQNEFPFLVDKKHIYNLLIDKDISSVNVGWDTFIFELHCDLKDGNEKLDGVTEFDNRKIKLEMALNNEDAKETIMHEILHCILAGIGLEERNFDGQSVMTTNEQLASSLSRQLQTLNNLNKGLMRIIYD
jgi:hypothetical protein